MESLKASLLESRESRQIADYYSQLSTHSSLQPQVTSSSSSALSSVLGGGSLDLRNLSYSLPGGAIAKLRNSPESAKTLIASPKPHPFHSSSSTPAFTLSGSNPIPASPPALPTSIAPSTSTSTSNTTTTTAAAAAGSGVPISSSPTSSSPTATQGANFAVPAGTSTASLPGLLSRQGTSNSVISTASSNSSGSGDTIPTSTRTTTMGVAIEKKAHRAQSATGVPPSIGSVTSSSSISIVGGGSAHGSLISSAAGSEKDLDDDVGGTIGTLTYMTELDYQDLVEKTPGRPWPKILNLRKITSVEENKASEKFKEELLTLNVNMVKPGDLVFHSLLGRGSSANVYQGVMYQGTGESSTTDGAENSGTDSSESCTQREVAIKILNTSPTDLRSVLKAHKETMDELVVVQRVQSPHVVRLFGITIEPSICIVLEFCHKGSLYDVLCSDMQLGWSQCLQWFREITLGTLALHSSDPVIVHRDLKSLNLLVDNQNKIKVADFGLSRLNEGSADQLATLSKMRGTYIYCAPEIYFGEPFTPLSDVYSIGIIFWELIVKLITGHYQRPFAEYPAVSFGFQVVIMASRKGVRPTIPSCPRTMQQLLISMWNSSPKNRPSCKDLLMLLDHIEQEYSEHKEEWDMGLNFVPEMRDVQPPPIEFLGAVGLAATASAAQSGFGAPSSSSSSSNLSPSGVGSAIGGSSSSNNNAITSPRSSALAYTGSSSSALTYSNGGKSTASSAAGSTAGAGQQQGAFNTADGAKSSSSAAKFRKTAKTSLPSFKAIFPAGKEKDKSSKRRSVGKQKPHFDDLLTDAKLYKSMETKLHKEHSVEYLHFYRAVRQFEQRFKDKGVAENLSDAKYIETLLEHVSGDDRLIEQIKAKIENSNPDQGMFADIQGEVTGILKTKFLALSD